MPPGLHLFLMTVALFVGPAAGIIAGVATAAFLNRNQSTLSFEALAPGFLVGAFGGFFLMRFLFMRVITARCPKCKGKAKVRGGHPIQYICQSCGHVHSTGISEGTPHHYS